MRNETFQKCCVKCGKEKTVSRTMIYQMRKGVGLQCLSCSSKGNKRRLGHIHSEETKEKMRMASLGKPKSASHRENMSKARKGIKMPHRGGVNHYLWIADRTKLAKRQERNDSAYKDWRKSVRDRDGWRCKMANSDCLGKVVAHHILPWRDFVELRYEINNGITLCRFHHPRKRADEMKLSPYFQQLVMSNSN